MTLQRIASLFKPNTSYIKTTPSRFEIPRYASFGMGDFMHNA